MSATADRIFGKPFMHPLADYVLIGGAWSIVAAAYLLSRPSAAATMDPLTLAVLILVVNSAHFAASTLRLYSQPENYAKFPFLTLAFPLVTIGVLVLCLALPMDAGRHLQALYLTWSPYHYAAQTFGVGLMYCFRSGCQLTPLEKRLFWWACMLPFFRSFLGSPNAGLGWFVPRETIMGIAFAPTLLGWATDALLVLIFLAPVALVAHVFVAKRKLIPFIVIVMLIANGLWWTAFDYLNAFVLATIAHGLQYLAIVLVFHVKERMSQSGNVHGRPYHAATFYGKCLALGYGLFYCWPYAFVWAGAGLAESMLLVTAVINIHHFIVDRYIWRPGGRASAKEPAGVTPSQPPPQPVVGVVS